jgi:hypothetical protein
MIMVRPTAKAVYRDKKTGTVHYLSSSPDFSELIFTSPDYGVVRAHFDGPVRMVKSRAGHMYEMISATESTTITPTTTGMLLHTIGGICFYCTGPDADWSLPYGERHDYELWPHCPGDKRQVQPRSEREPEPAPASSPGSAQRGAGVRWLDAEQKPEPVPEEPVTPPDVRWGPGPGAYW